MPYCIKLSEFDESKQKIVGGPWKESCEDCSFASSSSSSPFETSSSSSGKFTCDYTIPTDCLEGELFMDSSNPNPVLTDFYLEEGDSFKITAYGCASCYSSIPGHCDAGPDGDQFSGFYFLRLIGSIGPSGWGEEFVVGSNFEGVAENSGNLYLKVYDWAYSDNQGNFCVKIEATNKVSSSSSSSVLSSSSSSTEFCEYNGQLFPRITITKPPITEEDITETIDQSRFVVVHACKGEIIRRSFTVEANFYPEVSNDRKVYAWYGIDSTASPNWQSVIGWTATPSGTNVIPTGTGGGVGWWAGGDTINIEVNTDLFCPPNAGQTGQVQLLVSVGYLGDDGLVYGADELCDINNNPIAGLGDFFAVSCDPTICSSSSSSSSSSKNSSSSSEDDFFGCLNGACVSISGLTSEQLASLSYGPFFGTEECEKCVSSSSSSINNSISSSSSINNSSSSSSSSSSGSSSSSNDCPPCRMSQIPCGCWNIPLMTEAGIKNIGIPKFLNLGIEVESVCFSTYLYDFEGFRFELCAFQPPNSLGEDCFSGCPCGPTDDLISSVDLSPSLEILTSSSSGNPPGRVQVWESDNDDCEEGEELINPRWLTQNFTLKVSGCGEELEFPYEISFSDNGIQISQTTGETAYLMTCRPPVSACYGDIEPEKYFISIAGQNWQTRYRREYDDYTLMEVQRAYSYMNSANQSFWHPHTFGSKILLVSEPTCRTPDTSSFCGCFEESLYNVIDLDDLESYEMPPDGCEGRPLDIDVVCGKGGFDAEGNEEVEGGVTMYYTTYLNTVPVINNVAYDVLDLPAPPPGKINVIKIYKAPTRNGIRQWVCSNLKFATVRDDWRTEPVIGSGQIGSDFSKPEQNVNFNWPYNDLYFSDGCPGGDSVNLIPC